MCATVWKDPEDAVPNERCQTQEITKRGIPGQQTPKTGKPRDRKWTPGCHTLRNPCSDQGGPQVWPHHR